MNRDTLLYVGLLIQNIVLTITDITITARSYEYKCITVAFKANFKKRGGNTLSHKTDRSTLSFIDFKTYKVLNKMVSLI